MNESISSLIRDLRKSADSQNTSDLVDALEAALTRDDSDNQENPSSSQHVKQACQAYMEHLRNGGMVDDLTNLENAIFEAAMTSEYGPAIFDEINELIDKIDS